MSTYTGTQTSPPTCENCGRDKSATYICDACVNKLNAATRKLTAERDELQRRLAAVVAKISEAVVSDDDCVCSMLCHSAIIAIAEDE